MAKDGKAVEKEIEVIHVQVDDLLDSPFNPRKRYPEAEMKELAASIKAAGVLVPILVRKVNAGKHEIVYGHRRVRACRLAEVSNCPAMVRDLADEEVQEIQIMENLQRQDVGPMEEARGYKMLLAAGKYNVLDLSVKFGKSESYIRTRLQLLKLDQQIQKDLDSDDIPLTVAMELAKLPQELQAKAYKELDVDESPARMIEKIRDGFHLQLKTAGFDTTDPELVPKAGPCTTCAFRTGNQPELFQGVHADTCTRPGCFRGKEKAHAEKEAEAFRKLDGKVLTGQKASDAKRDAVDLDDQCHSAPGSRTWKSWLGKEGLAELDGKTFMVVEKENEYRSDSPTKAKLYAPRPAVMAAIRKQGHKWAKTQNPVGSSSAKKSPAEKLKDERRKVIDVEVMTEFMRLCGEAMVKAFDKVKPTEILTLALRQDIDDYFVENEEAAAKAFGEHPEASSPGKYQEPWSNTRIKKLPLKDLVRLHGIFFAENNHYRGASDLHQAVGFNEKAYRKDVENRLKHQEEGEVPVTAKSKKKKGK